jgi:RNA-directed DNA polymerase
VMGSIRRYIEEKLKLGVNEKKSQAGHVSKGVFLGYTISGRGELKASKESINRLKEKVRYVTRRNKGKSIEEVIRRVNEVLIGWRNYFRYDKRKEVYEKIEKWIRRRIRSYRLKQGKRREV